MSENRDMPRDAARVTPWALVFGEAVFDAARFEEVRRQADSVGAHGADELFMLPAAGALLQALTPPEGGRDAVAQVRSLIHAAFHFWRHGRNVYRLPEPLLRELLRGRAADPAPPVPAGYVQLPRNVIWARIEEDAAPEPVDGFFWSVPDDDPAGALDLLFALGVRAGRPGLSLFDARLESLAQLAAFGHAQARAEGDDFANVLPGGELQGYHALTNGAEALKLAARCLGALAQADAWPVIDAAGQCIHAPDHG